MPRTSDLPKLEQQLAKVQRQIRAAKAAEKKQARANDARRKIICGALAENHALANRSSDFATVYVRLLKEYVRPEDRHLFAETFEALLPPAEAALLLSSTPPALTDPAQSDPPQAETAA